MSSTASIDEAAEVAMFVVVPVVVFVVIFVAVRVFANVVVDSLADFIVFPVSSVRFGRGKHRQETQSRWATGAVRGRQLTRMGNGWRGW